MKVGGFSLSKTLAPPRNASLYRDSTAHIEGAVLLTVAVIGGLGNLLILLLTACCSRFRTTSSAFLTHHCLLDAVKSLFCIPFACALLLSVDIPYCNALGASYIFLMTLTAYNLLAVHINEEYQLSEQPKRRKGYRPFHVYGGSESKGGRYEHLDKNNSFCCISFGLFMIWFTTILIHLGVAFLPSSAEFSYDIGNCVFNYGTPKNYVIHILWMILVTGALGVAIVCFALFYRKLRARMHSEKWTELHKSISKEFSQNQGDTEVDQLQNTGGDDQEELHYEFTEGPDQTSARQMRLCLRRVVVMLLMVISFLLFWYPLFLLTALDVHYEQPPQAYRACMVLAWSQPMTTPLFCGIIYYDITRMASLKKVDYTTAIPMKDSTSFSKYTPDETRHRAHRKYRMQDLGFTNENFSFSSQSSPSVARNVEHPTIPQYVYEGEGHSWCHCNVGQVQGSYQTLIM